VLRLDATDPWIRWDWLGHHTDVIWQALVQHIQLTGIAVLGGLAIATPVGLLVWRWRALRNPVLSVAGILYTIPSLALSIDCAPLNAKSWMRTSFSYWEGPIGFAGSHSGVGYLELTGY